MESKRYVLEDIMREPLGSFKTIAAAKHVAKILRSTTRWYRNGLQLRDCASGCIVKYL